MIAFVEGKDTHQKLVQIIAIKHINGVTLKTARMLLCVLEQLNTSTKEKQTIILRLRIEYAIKQVPTLF